jgi:hypothetical protein
MVFELLLVASTCLNGGERIDISRHIAPTAKIVELEVTLDPAGSVLIVYSPGYEDKAVRFTGRESRGWVQIAEPVLCIKAIRGPFEFNIQIRPAPIACRVAAEQGKVVTACEKRVTFCHDGDARAFGRGDCLEASRKSSRRSFRRSARAGTSSGRGVTLAAMTFPIGVRSFVS